MAFVKCVCDQGMLNFDLATSLFDVFQRHVPYVNGVSAQGTFVVTEKLQAALMAEMEKRYQKQHI